MEPKTLHNPQAADIHTDIRHELIQLDYLFIISVWTQVLSVINILIWGSYRIRGFVLSLLSGFEFWHIWGDISQTLDLQMSWVDLGRNQLQVSKWGNI